MREDYDKDFKDSNCKICGQRVSNRRSLGNHLMRSHGGWNLERYVLELCLEGTVPICKCGCSQEVQWHRTKYRYNDYVSGHNNRFGKDNQPTFSKEQIKRRNEKIKQSYQIKRKEITDKISESLKKTFDCEEHRERMSIKANALWSVAEFRAKVSEGQRRFWQENYAERYKKVFTKEMRRKLSLANRDNRTQFRSKLEKNCISILKEKFGDDLKESYWLNGSVSSKCYDAVLLSSKTLIELDGVYWHGLDRSADYTLEQISNMANDRCKERIAAENGHGLVRIALNDETPRLLQGLSNLQEIIDASYHHQTKDGVLKDGRFLFGHDNQPLLSRENLLAWFAHPEKGKLHVSKRALPVVVRFFREYFECRPWFYPPCEQSIDEVLVQLKQKPRETDGQFDGACKDGGAYLKSRFRSYWHAGNGPAMACKDEKTLNSVISYRMGINNSKPYEYELSDGSRVVANETFDITPKNIRNGFVVQRKALSWFSPALARDIWRWALRGHESETPRVWDPSGGFGARMLGFAAAFERGEYIATEPASMTHGDLQSLANELSISSHWSGSTKVHRMGSELLELEPCSLDAVFTSPPYFNREKYFDEFDQCWLKYPSLELWIKGYLAPTFLAAFKALKSGRRMVINVSDGLKETVIQSAIAVGFKEDEHGILNLRRDAYSKKRGTIKSLTEPVLSFVKR